MSLNTASKMSLITSGGILSALISDSVSVLMLPTASLASLTSGSMVDSSISIAFFLFSSLPLSSDCCCLTFSTSVFCSLACYICMYAHISLSTLVLNSRDWSEIVWLPEISRFKINLAINFIRKKPTGMHWLGYNDAVSSLTKQKLEYFSLQPILKISKFACISSASLPASQPACRKTRLR